MKLELLALKWAVTEKFREYLLGGTFVVFTDNNPLSYLQTTMKLGATEARWVAQLAQFNFEVKYRSGRANGNADALSRKKFHGLEASGTSGEPAVSAQEVVMAAVLASDGTMVVPPEVRTMATKWQEVVRVQEVGVADCGTDAALSTLPCRGPAELAQLQQEDEIISRLLAYRQAGHRPTRRQMGKECKVSRKLLGQWDRVREHQGVLYRCVQDEGR